jgi:hypothetical protein
MDAKNIEAFTTYIDNKSRKWVVTGFFYNNEENREEKTHVSIYLVDSYLQFKHLEYSKFKEFVTNKQFVLIANKKID